MNAVCLWDDKLSDDDNSVVRTPKKLNVATLLGNYFHTARVCTRSKIEEDVFPCAEWLGPTFFVASHTEI